MKIIIGYLVIALCIVVIKLIASADDIQLEHKGIGLTIILSLLMTFALIATIIFRSKT